MVMGECGIIFSLLQLQFLPQEVASSSRVGEVPGSLSIGSRCETSMISSPLRHIKAAMHLSSSCAALQKTLVGAPYPSAHHCRSQARARVFSCIMVQKAL